MLIDFSIYLRINLFTLGKCYLKLIDKLCLKNGEDIPFFDL